MKFIERFIKKLGGNVHEKIDDQARELTLARLFYIYFYIIFTAVGIYIVTKIISDRFFVFEFSELTFVFLITLYTLYLYLGFVIFNRRSQFGYLLMTFLILILGLFIMLIWGVLHAHGLALILLATQLAFYISNRRQRSGFLLIQFALLVIISVLQINEILPYAYQNAGIYYNELDIALVLSYLFMSIITATIHTDTRETLVRQLRKLYREIQRQNLKLKRDLIIEINRRMKLEKSIVDLRNTKAVETEYQNAMELVSTNNQDLEEKSIESVNGKSTIHTLANEFQKLILDIYNAELSNDERKKIHNKIVNINREFDTYKTINKVISEAETQSYRLPEVEYETHSIEKKVDTTPIVAISDAPTIEPLHKEEDSTIRQIESKPVAKSIPKPQTVVLSDYSPDNLDNELVNQVGEIKVSSLIRAIGNDLGLKVVFKAPAKEPYVRSSLSSLRTVFYNLLINAKQAGADEILVTIKKPRGSTPPLLEIRVQDDGRGITLARYKDVLVALESPQVNLQNDSSGYLGAGLVITKEIVRKQLGGTLTVKRARSTGNFAATVRIPIKRRLKKPLKSR
jgi:signal transduction histidine kinase